MPIIDKLTETIGNIARGDNNKNKKQTKQQQQQITKQQNNIYEWLDFNGVPE